MSWKYMEPPEQGPPSDQAPDPSSLLADYTAQIRHGLDQHEAFNADLARQRADADRQTSAFASEQKAAQRDLDRLYADSRYAPLEPVQARWLHASLEEYDSLLTKPGEARRRLGSTTRGGITPELAAATLAAASILHEEPLSLHPLMRYLGLGFSSVDTNLQMARACLLLNQILIAAPDGARGLSDEELHGFRVPNGDELDRLQVGYTGLTEPPTALLVLASDAILSGHAAILPLAGRHISDRRLRTARDIIGKTKRLAASRHMEVHELHLQKKEVAELADARKTVAGAQARVVSERQRNAIGRSVHVAAMRMLGFGPADTAMPSTMAELLVAQAHLTMHEAQALPDHILTAVASRLMRAAQKDGIRSAAQLPGGANGEAAHVYTPFVDYLQEKADREVADRRTAVASAKTTWGTILGGRPQTGKS